MNIQELYSFLTMGEQNRNVENKQSISWIENATKAKIVKAILAFFNIQNGGYLILGALLC